MAESARAEDSRRGLRAVTHWFGRWPLFAAILLWVVLALVVFTVLGWVWGEGGLRTANRWLTNWRSAGAEATPLDVVKVSLTTIGGIGGTGYLVIKYRERASAERAERTAELARKDAEQEKAEQKLLSAVQQLGSESPQVRIAGVYALTDVADTHKGPYRQRVVNILCGYLRTQRGTWEDVLDGQDSGDGSATKRIYVSNDGPVESTILEVLSRHLRKGREVTESRDAVIQEVEDDQLWCDCTIDLHGATFTEYANFGNTTFTSHANFKCATFKSLASFQNTIFKSDTDYSYTTFESRTTFTGATFGNFVDLQHSIFHSNASFSDTRFLSYVSLQGVNFGTKSHFSGSKFSATHRIICRSDFPPFNNNTGLPEGAQWVDFDDEGDIVD